MVAEAERRVALVTGSGKGVGAGIVKVLCAHGVRCCVNCNTNPQMAQETLKAIEDEGGEAFVCQADITRADQLSGMVNAIVERWGRLDILVNNAAMQYNRFADQYDADMMRQLWEINIGGYYRAAKACLPYLRQSPCARIVNISSIHGKRPTTFDAGYAMTKGAIRMFTRELALELLADHIPVNAIDLGGCRIEFKTGHPHTVLYVPLDVRNPDMKAAPQMVTPQEVGELVWYLCSEYADALNGDGIRMDRGAVLT